MDRRLSVAPMMQCTDRDDRYLLRLLSRRVLLYTEMVTAAALLHGDPERLLAFDPVEHPVALQVAGSDPSALARAAHLGVQAGYDEINLNLGCPSDRVQQGRFGACLMAEPALVAECVAAMRAEAAVPVTVKTRIGIDHRDSYEELYRFVETVAAAGCRVFSVHARKAWLCGLSPRENREVPPLRYGVVHRLKRDFPGLAIVINGGIRDLDAVQDQLRQVDGVMVGRAAYHDPWMLADADRRVFGADGPATSRHQVLQAYARYVRERLDQGAQLQRMARHVLGLFQGLPGARAFRRHISQHGHRHGAGAEVLEDGACLVRESATEPMRRSA
ncbi:MAG TPA: tRNA dihydrouridine(20/20a) synthase DusA [Gammaproteobacteria bacterium]|nr:tRNA dihydrouridine(20/20a) synthase DusA [Gammaproteobacteria bacterium]